MIALPMIALLHAGVPAGEPQPADRVVLTWDAPAECPTAAAVQRRIAARLGRALTDVTSDDAVRARAVVSRAPGGYAVDLVLESRTGGRRRTLDAASCEVLADTTALLVAIAIDPDVAPAASDLEPEPQPEHPEPAPSPSPAAAEPTPRPSAAPAPRATTRDVTTRAQRRARPRGAVRVGAGAGVGPLPGFAPAIDVAGALLLRRVRIEAGFAWWFDRSIALADSNGRARLRLWSLDVRGCWVPAWGRFELPLCGGVAAGAMRGEGIAIEAPARTRIAWIAFEAGLAAVFLPSRFVALWLGADLLAPVTRPGFALAGRPTAHRAFPVGGYGLAGVEVRFP